jgi:hypothetical protein
MTVAAETSEEKPFTSVPIDSPDTQKSPSTCSRRQPLIPDEILDPTWQDSIFRQRAELARMLREPLTLLAGKCVPSWGDRERLNAVLLHGFSGIPYCCYLYVVDTNCVQTSDNVIATGLMHGYYQCNRAERPYMKEAMPPWGFLLSDAYVSLTAHRTSLTALQVVISDTGSLLGYLGADFELRSLPVTSAL